MNIMAALAGSGDDSGGMTVSASPPSLSQSGRQTVFVTSSVKAIVSDYSGSFTVAWTIVSGDAFSPNTPTSLTTTFTIHATAGEIYSAVARCTVTGSGGSPVRNVDVSLSFTNTLN